MLSFPLAMTYFYLVNQRAILYIIVLMSISLIGLIALQAYWIGIKVKQSASEFDKNVFQSLSDIRDKLEEKEAFVFIQSFEEDGSEPVEEEMTLVINLKEELERKQLHLKKAEKVQRFELRQIEEKVREAAEDENVRREMIIRTNNEGQEVEELLHFYEKKKNTLKTALDKIAFNYAFRQTSLKERLEGVKIDSIIQQSLLNRGITESSFNYYVSDNEGDSLIFSSAASYPSDSSALYSTPILTENTQNTGGTLAINFNNRSKFILQNIWLSLFISILLTGILLYTFSYTIMAILRQKKFSRIKSDFINNMTHEFKTPIATISLAVDSMLHPLVRKNEKEVDRFGAIIKKENARMNDQIERVLELAKFEKGEFSLNLEPIDVKELLEELYENFKLSMDDKAGDIQLILKANNFKVKADQLHLYNALRNIVENGIKFSKEAFRIKIQAYNKGENLVIEIEDKGIGMDAETQKRAFDRFFRKSEGNLHNTKGFGLGLNYVKEVLQRMNAQIFLKSKLGEGTRFSILIPNSHE